MQLTIQNNIDGSQRTIEINKPLTTVGRSAVNDVILYDDRISAQHITLELGSDFLTVRDNGSINGTRLNGRPLQPGEGYRFGFGDRLEIGNSLVTLYSPFAQQEYSQPQNYQAYAPPPPSYSSQQSQYAQYAPPQYYPPQQGIVWTMPWMSMPVAQVPTLTGPEMMMLNNEMEARKKSAAIAYLLWFFLGWLGIHKFYLNRVGEGIIYIVLLFSVIGWFILPFLLLIDLFLIPNQASSENRRLQWEIANRIMWSRGGYYPPTY